MLGILSRDPSISMFSHVEAYFTSAKMEQLAKKKSVHIGWLRLKLDIGRNKRWEKNEKRDKRESTGFVLFLGDKKVEGGFEQLCMVMYIVV